jgi:radical SAM superfamily enzyme YgiQ (UPF0313 family)
VKLLLIAPAQLRDNGEPIKSKQAFMIPLTPYLLAGLTPPEWEVRIVHEYTEEIPFEGDFDLVGITVTTLHSKRAYQIARRFRDGGVTVVLGGFHPTLFPDEAEKHADALMLGEAEQVWETLLADAASGRLQKRYRADCLHDLQVLPVPRYDRVNLKHFRIPVFPVEFSRGCPYNCDYCSVTQFYGHKHRVRPPEQVVRDILATDSRFIGFVDDNIAGSLDRAAELFEAMIPLNLRWSTQVSLRLADNPEVLALAARSGLRYAIVGIETLDPQNLASVNKLSVNQVAQYIPQIRLFQKHGITVCTNLMFGFDGDSPETFEQAFRFIESMRVMVNPYIVTPYPGTRLYERMESDGRLLHTEYWRYTSYRTVFQPRNFSPDELDCLFLSFYRRCFSLPVIVKRFAAMLSLREPWGSFMTQVAVAANSLEARKNLRHGILPYF